MPLGKYFQLSLTILLMSVFLILIVLCLALCIRKKNFLSKLKYSTDDKLFLKNIQNELLLISCYWLSFSHVFFVYLLRSTIIGE